MLAKHYGFIVWLNNGGVSNNDGFLSITSIVCCFQRVIEDVDDAWRSCVSIASGAVDDVSLVDISALMVV